MPTDHQQQNPRHSIAMPESLQPGLRSAFEANADIPAQLTAQAAQIAELRAHIEQLRAERDRLLEQQRRVADLVQCSDPAKLVHDLRNVLNELHLYKMLAETTSTPR